MQGEFFGGECDTCCCSPRRYNSTLDKYVVYADVLKAAQDTHGLSTKGALAYLGNQLVGASDARQQIAVVPPAKFSYKDEL